MGDKLKPLLAGIGVVAVLGGAYYWYTQLRTPASDVPVVENETTGTPLVVDAAVLNAEVVEVLRAIDIIRTIHLDTKFFEDPRFRALRATPVEIPAAPVPRRRTFDLVAPPPPPPPPSARR